MREVAPQFEIEPERTYAGVSVRGSARCPTVRSIRKTDKHEWARLWNAWRRDRANVAPCIAEWTLFNALRGHDRPDMFGIVASYDAEPHAQDEATETLTRRQRFKRRLSHRKGDRLVGIAHAVLYRDRSAFELECVVHDLYVDVSERRRGIGRSLMAGVEKRARELNARSVSWSVRQDDGCVRQFSDRLEPSQQTTRYERILRTDPIIDAVLRS